MPDVFLLIDFFLKITTEARRAPSFTEVLLRGAQCNHCLRGF